MLGFILASAILCAPFDKANEALEAIGEKIIMVGRTSEGYVLVYATKDGMTWTIVSVDHEAKACVVADGGQLRMVSPGRGT
jgi:hypothetical protein